MGYGYGVWLVIEDDHWVSTNHIPHITIACYMTFEDACSLYDDILKIMLTPDMRLNVINDIVDFDDDMYPDDDNNLHAWGYNLTCDFWSIFKSISIVYNCNFSFQPHTSVEYGKDPSLFNKIKPQLSIVNCRLVVADITSDDPKYWKKV